jgi:alpha-tubulin suppressor-like RCC1 family protein
MRENLVIIDIAAGGRHSMVLMEDGSLYTFGFGTNG